jgi:hypothetical protein
MRASFGYGGWVAIDDLGLPGPLYVRVREAEDGRLTVREFYLDASRAESPIGQRDLREFPLSALEAFVNANRHLVKPGPPQGEPGPDLSTLASHFDTMYLNIDPGDWVALSFASQMPERMKAAGARPIRKIKPKSVDRWRVVEDDREFRLNGASPQKGLTDEFLRDVARAYSAAVQRGERPNRAIAEQTGYPLKTAQRWVYTARDRKIMPRGRKGRAG